MSQSLNVLWTHHLIFPIALMSRFNDSYLINKQTEIHITQVLSDGVAVSASGVPCGPDH